MMTSTQVVETPVTTTDNTPSQDYTHPSDQTTQLHVIISDILVFLSSLIPFFTNFDADLDHLSHQYLHARPQIL